MSSSITRPHDCLIESAGGNTHDTVSSVSCGAWHTHTLDILYDSPPDGRAPIRFLVLSSLPPRKPPCWDQIFIFSPVSILLLRSTALPYPTGTGVPHAELEYGGLPPQIPCWSPGISSLQPWSSLGATSGNYILPDPMSHDGSYGFGSCPKIRKADTSHIALKSAICNLLAPDAMGLAHCLYLRSVRVIHTLNAAITAGHQKKARPVAKKWSARRRRSL